MVSVYRAVTSYLAFSLEVAVVIYVKHNFDYCELYHCLTGFSMIFHLLNYIFNLFFTLKLPQFYFRQFLSYFRRRFIL